MREVLPHASEYDFFEFHNSKQYSLAVKYSRVIGCTAVRIVQFRYGMNIRIAILKLITAIKNTSCPSFGIGKIYRCLCMSTCTT